MQNSVKYALRLIRLVVGLFLYGLGGVLTIKGNIGYAPFDVLNSGISNMTGMPIGTAVIVTGLGFLVIAVLMGERIGLGTVLNMLLIGTFMNMILDSGLIPTLHNFWAGLLLVLLGLFVIAIASYLYIGSGLCAGPRDSLMVAIKRLTKWPVGVCRTLLEGAVVLVGWLLGGNAGIGTVISAFGVGVAVQIVFFLVKFDPAAIKHETLADTWRLLRARFKGQS